MKNTRVDANCAGHRRKMRGEYASSYTYSKMRESARKRRNIYVEHTKDRSKPICIIHSPVHSSDECKVLGNFGFKYAKRRPTKDHGEDLANRNKFDRQG